MKPELHVSVYEADLAKVLLRHLADLYKLEKNEM